MLKINRFEVDFRDKKRKHLPVTTNLPEYGKYIWKDWEDRKDLEGAKQETSMKWNQEFSILYNEALTEKTEDRLEKLNLEGETLDLMDTEEPPSKRLLRSDEVEEGGPLKEGSEKERLSAKIIKPAAKRGRKKK
jgi:hypothetical protein